MDLEIKILLVEDNFEDAAVTKRVLLHNKLNNGLVIATSGKEALAALQNIAKADLPQLILLDINLPDISGIDLLTCIKKDNNLQSIPVVILTGSNEDQDIQKSYDLGAGSYLVKPISNDALMLVIEKLFYPWGQTPRYIKISSIIPTIIHRRLQDHCPVNKSGMAKYGAKALLAYLPETDMLMPIQMRSYGSLAIVEMKKHKQFPSDAILKLIQRRLQCQRGS